jgi:glycosyltransferase involved in cell wall biosynthesis
VTSSPSRGPVPPLRALVVTVVHHPQDARVHQREIAALLEHGWHVTYAAPFTGHGLSLTDVAAPGLEVVDLPRSAGRRRLRALRAARSLLAARGPDHDVVLLHDPELLLAAAGARGLPPVVFDVHEDTAAATSLKPWLPELLRAPARAAVLGVERLAERRVHLLLADHAYADRFSRPHLVVPNAVVVPDDVVPPGDDRVVYVGHLTRARGAEVMVAAARRLAEASDGAVRVHLIGSADDVTTALVQAAVADDVLTWHGRLPSRTALPHLRGALAGLSLLRDEPNYRVSMPTKVVEYMAYGVPVVTTPLPLAAELVQASGGGVVVPFDDADAVVRAVLALRDDVDGRRDMAAAGHAAALRDHDWRRLSVPFVAELERVAREAHRG